jgi:hypothetical protein
MEVVRVLGSVGLREYDALRVANILNGGHLNCVLEQMGVPYFPRPQLPPRPHRRPIRNRRPRWQRNQSLKSKGWFRPGPSVVTSS